MKWHYVIETMVDGSDSLEGSVYGTFKDALSQVNGAIVHNGWERNTAPVAIELKPEPKGNES